MPVIAVVSRKGGSGKSTLATHVAAWLARGGDHVMLGDVDRKQATVPWLRRRQARPLPGAPLVGWAMDSRKVLRPPSGVSHVVLDTPHGLHGFGLSRLLMYADIVLMPVCDSVADRESAAACLGEMRVHPRVAAGSTQIGCVGMRIDARARSVARLRSWAEDHSLPFIGALREARLYKRCAESGLSVFDMRPGKVQHELAQWQPLLEWLTNALARASVPPAAPAHVPGEPVKVRARLAAAVSRRPAAAMAGGLAELVEAAVPAEAASGMVVTHGQDGGEFTEVTLAVVGATPLRPIHEPPVHLVAAPSLPPATQALGAAAAAAELASAGPLAWVDARVPLAPDGQETQAGPATVFPGDLMRPLGPPPTRVVRLRRLLRKLLPPPLLTRDRH